MALTDIPLFPLSAVLFPGGPLTLRIFEARYVDLVRHCPPLGFGICLILQGHETGVPAVPAAIGTIAKITDFYTQPDGLLCLRVQGGARFHVATTRVRDNGLVHGEVLFWPDEPVLAIPPEYGLLATILERLIDHPGNPHAHAERARFDDASWVGFRLAEALPLSNAERQSLLQTTDPLERLSQLMFYMPRFQQS